MNAYQLQRRGNLYYTEAAFRGPSSVSVDLTLIDTGSTYTLVSPKILQALGYDLNNQTRHVPIVSASRRENPYQVDLEWIQALGIKEDNFPVLAYALSPELRIDVVLGMDFMLKNKIRLDLGRGIAEIP